VLKKAGDLCQTNRPLFFSIVMNGDGGFFIR